MAEIVYQYFGKRVNQDPSNIRWLSRDELILFNEHLSLCGQMPLLQCDWDKLYDEDTIYCVLFENNIPIARACVEKYSSVVMISLCVSTISLFSCVQSLPFVEVITVSMLIHAGRKRNKSDTE